LFYRGKGKALTLLTALILVLSVFPAFTALVSLELVALECTSDYQMEGGTEVEGDDTYTEYTGEYYPSCLVRLQT